ncbi:hypothetical protein FRACYDRAFT_249568 [Fragilariopsis cylindrus CCMP1102]|uniref:Uncharacterized protein n=1 Tax=Fragilariopsis cylindrus CCMP1102 TaxID=635003 RepID=A0A1E7ES47_9STRA|nr:hypothetical protein FRACYDRAFT_249568 [Fragilariopsis cylindrus CCMP1102]|eukprot:OEU08667.1 hypothetical protein FRACYDRAFT_249568 [Fragilariopsis cylindrus CCMP1102]
MSNDESARRLSLAAAELAELMKATYKQTEDINIDIQREVADDISDMKVESIALKTDMNNKWSTVNNKLNTVNQNLQENRKMMESLMAAMKEEGKKNRIVNALNSERKRAGGWCYDEKGIDWSESLIINILSNFLEGRGRYISSYTTRKFEYQSDASLKKESEKAFRAKLKREILNITGTTPTIVLEDDQWVIYHG